MISMLLKRHMQNRFADMALDTKVDIYRNMPESDGLGGVKNNFIRIASNIPARIQSGTAGVRAVRMDESQIGQSAQSVGFVQIALPYGTDIRTQDRVHHFKEKYEIGYVDQTRSESILRITRANIYREK